MGAATGRDPIRCTLPRAWEAGRAATGRVDAAAASMVFERVRAVWALGCCAGAPSSVSGAGRLAGDWLIGVGRRSRAHGEGCHLGLAAWGTCRALQPPAVHLAVPA